MRKLCRVGSAGLLIAGLALSPTFAQTFSGRGPTPKVPPLVLGGCYYLPAGFTIADEAQSGLTCDSSGALRVNVVTGGGGGGGGGGAVYGPTATGAAPTGTGGQPVLNGFLDGGGLVRAVSPTTQLPVLATDNLTQVGGATFSLGQKAGSASLPVILASDQSALPVNNAQWAGTTLGAPSAYGTAPTGNVPGMNAFVTNFPATQPVSGTVTANQGSPPWSTTDTNSATTITTPGTAASKAQGVQGTNTTGTTATALPVLTGGVDGSGNLRPFLTTSAGGLVLGANANIIGNVRIDQTTNGTTNAITLADGTTPATLARLANPTADGVAASIPGLYVLSRGFVFNGTSFDRAKGTGGNANATVIPQSAASSFSAFTVTTTSASGTGGLAAATRKTLWLKNQAASGGGTISVCPNSVTATATAATAGCVDLKPGDAVNMCTDSFCPGDQFNIIATATAPLTVLSN